MRPTVSLEPHAILVADMVGYSQRLADHPVATHLGFRSHLHHIFEPTVDSHGGRVVKTTGDGIVAIFLRAELAERCGREIQLRLRRSRTAELASAPFQYRIAVHYGAIVIERYDVFGLDVNIAIHMQRMAPPDGVCVSDALFRLLPQPERERYRYLGEKYLKNIPNPVAVYTYDLRPPSPVAMPGSDLLPAARRRHMSLPPRIAIAEFDAIAESPSQRVLVSVAHDCLTRALSRFEDVLTVAPIGRTVLQTSSEQVRRSLSNEMRCEYLLRGTCIVGPSNLVLTVHLESLIRQQLIWSGHVEIGIDGRLEVIDTRIAAEIVAPVILYLERSEVAFWSGGQHSEDEVRFRQAKQLVEQRSHASLERARHLLTDILGRCGDVGDVYISLARAEHNLGLLRAGSGFAESMESAWRYAKKAVDLDNLNAKAHAELALQEMFLKRQDTATEIYEHALRLNPYDPMLRADWADSLVNVGRANEAVTILEEVLSGWPRDRAWVEWSLSDAYWALDRPDRTLLLLGRHRDQHHVHRNLAACHAKLGNLPEARRHADMVRELQPGFSAKAWREVMPDKDEDKADEFVDYLETVGL
jgi:adenylate cyclase